MKYVVLYEAEPDALATAPLHFPAHQARIADFHARGLLLMVGVVNGVVRSWTLREWNEALVP